jgi:hypothetical protein
MSEIKNNRFIPVSEWHNFHPWPKIGGLRHLIFHANTNGFDKCLIRVGRRLLIDEQTFFAWLDERRAGGGIDHG